ncbi:MAG: alpha/beta hydrolase [Deltaproteobacteria bacterium]|nr:alpha/beta hydrolase [Deltaproteobacteria bacterium]
MSIHVHLAQRIPMTETENNSKLNSRIIGDGPPLIMLPGLGLNIHIFDELVTRFAPEYQCICLDYSAGTDATACTIEALATDVHTWLTENDIQPQCIIGHSLGGFVSLRLHIDYPDDVPAMVLISSGAHGHPGILPLFEKIKGLSAFEMLLKNMEMSVAKSFRQTAAFEAAVAMQAKYSGSGRCYGDLLKAATTFDMREELSKIQCPTLILCGREDTIAPPTEMALLEYGIPNNVMICLERVGHLPQLEAPDQTASGIRVFLRQVKKGLITMPIVLPTWQS